jgi:hypothetical protein
VLVNFDDDDDDGGATAAIVKKAVAKAKQKTLALKLFIKDVANVKEDEYVITIKGTMRYELAMDHVSTRMSFHQVAAAMQHTKERCSLSKLGGINNTIVGQYVRTGVTFALQRIVDLCVDELIWALSLAGNGSTHRGQHFFDLRLCVCYRSVLLNLHLVAIPQFDRHTALNTFNIHVGEVPKRVVRPLAPQADQRGHRRRANHGRATQRPGDVHGPRGRASRPVHLVPATSDGRRRQGRRRDVI